MDTYITGKCEDMCPISEVNKRTREKLVHFYERDNCFVKEFSRSAAGRVQSKPEDLRTRTALLKTIRYLLTDVFNDDRRPFHIKYEFIFDRLRSVRQEIVIQNFEAQHTVEILEPIVMFLAYSRYHMTGEPIKNFDPKINDQHLQECLKKLLVCYDCLADDQTHQELLKNRPKFEALYILFNLGSIEAMVRCVGLSEKIKLDGNVALATKIALSYWMANYYKVLSTMKALPDILRAVGSLHIPLIRSKLLQIFATAYHNKQLAVPLTWIEKILLYESTENLTRDLKYFNLMVVDGQKVQMDKIGFDKMKPSLTNVKFQFVDSALYDCDSNNLFLGDS